MEKEPRTTKELLIQGSVRRLEGKYRQEYASGLLSRRAELASARPGLPAHWLKPRQLEFVDLEISSTVDAEIHAAAVDLADRVVQLCDLVYALLDDFSDRNLDQKQRATLRRGRGPALVCKVLFGAYRRWPPADPRKIGKRVRSDIDEALRNATVAASTQPRVATSAGGGAEPAVWPTNRYAFGVWHRTRATDDPQKLKRYIVLDLVEAFVTTAAGLITMVTLAAVYFGLFLALKHFLPDLTTREDMIVAGAAITAALGGSGAMLVSQVIRARLRGPGRPAAGSRPTDAEE